MALDSDELSIWDIGFRWAGYDPGSYWHRIRLPLPVRDNFSVLMKAILSGEVICSRLSLAKRPFDSKADPKHYIRTYLDSVYKCIHGQRYDRDLLKWGVIDRMSFLDWCHCRGIQPPEFWFPHGWKLRYEHPHDFLPGYAVRHQEPTDDQTICSFSYEWPDWITEDDENSSELQASTEPSLRENQLRRLFCRQIAGVLWKQDPNRRIADVIRDKAVQEFGGAKFYNEDTIRDWVKDLAPDDVRARRGRPPKKNGGQGDESDSKRD